MTIEEFAAYALADRKADLAAKYSQRQADDEQVWVKPGTKYTKVDMGSGHNRMGRWMVENATGNIYGIKGYGQVHKGHQYGTLDTVTEWDWAPYYPVRKSVTEPVRMRAVKTTLTLEVGADMSDHEVNKYVLSLLRQAGILATYADTYGGI